MSIIPSGSVPPPAYPWWAKSSKNDDVLVGTLAVVKPFINGLFRHEWAGEIVVILELVQEGLYNVPYYRVMCHRGTMVISGKDLSIID